MINLQALINDTIQIYENEICCGESCNENFMEIKDKFADLIIYLTRLHLEIRYCSKKDCPCSPEFHLKAHFEKNKELFQKYIYKPQFEHLEELTQ